MLLPFRSFRFSLTILQKMVFLLLICIWAFPVRGESNPFVEHQIVPRLLGEPPKVILSVTYEGGKIVDPGKTLAPKHVKNIPRIVWPYDDDVYYTIILTDPDAPSRQKSNGKEFVHYLVSNILGNDLNSGDTLFQYVGSGPPKGYGPHRYVFLLYKQSENINFDNVEKLQKVPAVRSGFSSEKILSNDLGLGEPIAANFFIAEYDDSVPQIHRILQNEIINRTPHLEHEI